MTKITVTYIIQFGEQKLTRSAEAEIEDGKTVSDGLAESLWKAARKSLPKEMPEPQSND